LFYAGLDIASAFVSSAEWSLGNGAAYFCIDIFAIKFPNIYFPHLVTGVPVIDQPLVTGYWPALIWPPTRLVFVLFSSTPFSLAGNLPSAALATLIRRGKAWRATKSVTWPLIAVALVVVVIASGLEVFVAPIFAKKLFLISLWKIVYG